MTAQVILVVIGAVCFLAAVVGSFDSVHLRIPHLGWWPRVALAIGGAVFLALAFTVAKPADNTSTTQPVASANPTQVFQSPASGTSTPNSRASTVTPLVACNNLHEALRKETDAIRAVNFHVEGDSVTPTGVSQPGYDRAKAHENKTNKVAQDALDAYTSAGLKVPTDQDIQTILDDISSFISRLPGEIHANMVAQAKQDWGAMQDRPDVLDQMVAPAISHQCGRL